MLKYKFRYSTILIVFIISFFSTLSNAKTKNRIVSLAPSITRSLYEMGAEKDVVGITIFCPKGTFDKQIIGTIWEPVLERIAKLEPTLIIATKEGNKKEPILKLKKLGFNVLILENADSYSKIFSNFKEIAKNVGRAQEAEILISNINSTLEDYKLEKRSNTKVFWQIGDRPLFTTGKNSFVNAFHEFAGGVNIFNDQNKRYFQVNREEVINREPEIIFISSMENSKIDESTQWRNIPGFQPRIILIENSAIFTPTPRTFLSAVELVYKYIHEVSYDKN